jgi:hypothetical protein
MHIDTFEANNRNAMLSEHLSLNGVLHFYSQERAHDGCLIKAEDLDKAFDLAVKAFCHMGYTVHSSRRDEYAEISLTGGS